jgi:hypothetical protein
MLQAGMQLARGYLPEATGEVTTRCRMLRPVRAVGANVVSGTTEGGEKEPCMLSKRPADSAKLARCALPRYPSGKRASLSAPYGDTAAGFHLGSIFGKHRSLARRSEVRQ